MSLFRHIKYRYNVSIPSGIMVAGLALYAFFVLNACDTTERVEPFQGEVFIKLMGSDGSEDGKDLLQLPDGGFVLVGATTSASILPEGDATDTIGGKDIYVVRTDEIGNVMWERRYGGAGDDVGSSVILSEDELSIYVCGEITQGEGTTFRDVWVGNISLDEGEGNSEQLINEQFYGDLSKDEYGTSILDIEDGGFLITSTWLTVDTSSFFMVETDENLKELDKKSDYVYSIKGVHNFSATSFERVTNSSFDERFVCFGTLDAYIYTGDQSEQKEQFQSFLYEPSNDKGVKLEIYGTGEFDERCTDACQTTDGGFVLAGYREDGIYTREKVVKVDADRIEMWSHDYTNIFNRSIGESCGIIQTQDGGYLVSSRIELGDPVKDEISLLKLDPSGELEWRQVFGSNDNDIATRVIQLEDGSYVLVGTIGFEINGESESKMGLIKVNSNGGLVPLN